jgi:ribosomal protein L22
MNKHAESQSTSEEVINQMLRDLPPRRAPARLAIRVLREVERRRAQPWWRRGFTRWPLGARAAFVVFCGAVIGLTAQGGQGAVAARVVAQAGAWSMAWAHPIALLLASAAASASWLTRVVPPQWAYGAMLAGATLYAALFGLGAAAYRLYRQPSTPGGGP